MTALLTYALNKKGFLVHIDSVPNGNGCGCVCPSCNGALCARNEGKKNDHHFAHQNGDCEKGVESVLHKMAKDILCETRCVQLPDRLDGTPGFLLNFDKVEVEFSDKETNLRPDCIGYYGDKKLWIEFKRSHAVDDAKKEKIISAKIDCIEINLNDCDVDPEFVRKFITDEKSNRVWIDEESRRIQLFNSKPESNYEDIEDNISQEHVLSHSVNQLIQRQYALDENGNIVKFDFADFKTHTYSCLACGKKLNYGIGDLGEYCFVHENKDSEMHCNGANYLREAAKEIIRRKFYSSNNFWALIPQKVTCVAKENCIFCNQGMCTTEKNFPNDLKSIGYTECIKDYQLSEDNTKCDLILRRNGCMDDAIIINITSNITKVNVDRCNCRIIDVEVSNESDLLSLKDRPLGTIESTYRNFNKNQNKVVPQSEMDNRFLWKFSLFSTGKYHVDIVTCSNANKRKHSTILEFLFAYESLSKYDAKLYSLIKCHEQNRPVCKCEICWYAGSSGWLGLDELICKRYKTKGTPHYPLQTMYHKCEYFSPDRELIDSIKQKYLSLKAYVK